MSTWTLGFVCVVMRAMTLAVGDVAGVRIPTKVVNVVVGCVTVVVAALHALGAEPHERREDETVYGEVLSLSVLPQPYLLVAVSICSGGQYVAGPGVSNSPQV